MAFEAGQMSFRLFDSGTVISGRGTHLNHGVLAVGYADGYFKVRNSWGASWAVWT